MDTTDKIRLGDFVTDVPDHKCVVGFYTSVGVPAGEEILLGDPDWTTPFDEILSDLEGSVDGDGVWHWDGAGNPTDLSRHTVWRIDAWYDDASKVEVLWAD